MYEVSGLEIRVNSVVETFNCTGLKLPCAGGVPSTTRPCVVAVKCCRSSVRVGTKHNVPMCLRIA